MSENLVDLIMITAKDVDRLGALLKENDDQFHRRLFIIMFLAHVEASLSFIKQRVLEAHHKGIQTRSHEEIAVIKEQNYVLDDKGTIQQRTNFLKLQSNFRFTQKFFFDHPETIKRIDNFETEGGWRDFVQAIRIRNRIVHPKKVKDLEITDGEKDTVIRAFTWFLDFVVTESGRVGKTADGNS